MSKNYRRNNTLEAVSLPDKNLSFTGTSELSDGEEKPKDFTLGSQNAK